MTDDDKTLVKRLRIRPLNMLVNPASMCSEAADYIEAQAAEIERLRSLVYLYVDPSDVTPEDEEFVRAAVNAVLQEYRK